MKVLQVNSVCGRGSTGRIVVSLHEALRDRGDESSIAYGRGHHDPAIDAFRIGTQLSVGMHAGLSRLTDRQGFYSSRATHHLLAEIKEYKPDVVHLHNVHGYYLNMAILFPALHKSNAQVIWTLHDCWAFTGHCSHFEIVGCEKWRTHCGRCPQKRSYPTSLVVDSSSRNFAEKRRLTDGMENLTIVTPSEWLRDLVRESFLGAHPVEVIRNGVDRNTFKPTLNDFKKSRGIIDKKMILGVAGTWTDSKGLRDFKNLGQHLGPDYVIVLVGLDPEVVHRLPLDIIGITRTHSTEELASIYSAADVFFNPTHEDTYPTTNLEAISCGTPVVTYDTGGSSESVAEDFGRVVPTGDLSRAAEELMDLCTRRPRASSPPPHFDQRHMNERYLSLYDRVQS